MPRSSRCSRATGSRSARLTCRGKIEAAGWESNALWYNASRYDATFAVANYTGEYPAARFEHFLGKPAATYRVASWLVLVYRTNLLRHIAPEPGPS